MPSRDPSPPPSPDEPAASPRKREPRLRDKVQHLILLARRAGLRRWLIPLALLAVIAGLALVLLGKMRRDVWAYYTDGSGTRVELHENKTRYVLWEDPQPQPLGDTGEADTELPPSRLEAAFSPDGTALVLVHAGDAGTGADLFLSRWNGRVWSKPQPLDTVNTPANERSPVFSHDGRHLYFSSDRPGGAGGYDLYLAREQAGSWTAATSLGAAVNTSGDETGPALSPGDTTLYFSSNRDGTEADDIFVAHRRGGDEGAPEFDVAEIVSPLNSKAHDVQAALSSRGDRIFLASDRERSGRSGYRLYFSRVIDGVSLPPEQVDLYIDRGDVTDPAVRWDGFDLLFSANHEADGQDNDYRLYRTTTREVIGYTDLSRWAQFKQILANVAWWILLAAAALIALLYLLEKWQDITSLFHKCLAGSAAVHLLLLLAAMLWLIAQEFESREPPPPAEISVSVDALAEEQLAMESIPEETELTEPDLSLPNQKVESAFDVPEMEPQEAANAFPVDAAIAKEAMQVEVKPAAAAPSDQPVLEPTEPSALLSELSETQLPEPETPTLEERVVENTTQPAAPSEQRFEPAEPAPVAQRTDSQPPSDTAAELPTESTAVQPSEPVASQQSDTPMTEVRPSQSDRSAADSPSATAALDSQLLTDLPQQSPADANSPFLEESNGAPADGAADPAQDAFTPGGAGSQIAASKSDGGAQAGAATEDAAETSQVTGGELAATPLESGPATAIHEAQLATSPPEPAADLAPTPDLPTTALIDPGLPQLDEGNPSADAPVDSAANAFQPGSAPQNASAQLDATPLADTAAEAPAPAAEVGAAELATTPAPLPSPAVREAHADSSLPEVALRAADLGPVASPPVFDNELPQLEEGATAGTPADDTGSHFTPSASAASAAQARSEAQAGEAANTSLDPASVASGETGPASALAAASPLSVEASSSAPGVASSLAPAVLDPAAAVGLLPDSLEAPAMDARAMTDFLKKQGGRPSMDVIEQLGGSDGTERAIRASIRWLAENQEPDGRWDAREHGAKGDFDTGVTGLALLCFYGWGARHDQPGDYRDNVRKGIDYLLGMQQDNGDLSGDGLMYCHAIASIALCEAYGITNDARLRKPAERAIAYTLAAQSKTKGGWRYHPGDDSDTSITGWQYMALHSARMAGLEVPEKPFDLARDWLDRVGGGKHGGLYGYQAPAKNSPAMVATGMFCRQLDLVAPGDPKMAESAAFLGLHPMQSQNLDYYYVYYATLALYQHQGPGWRKWNERLKEVLPLVQHQTGSRKGSWDPSRGLAGNGGRVTSTALATLSLEVYYRLLPMYGFRGDEPPPVKVKEHE